MNVIAALNEFKVVKLDKEFASSHVHDLTLMADQIPLVEYTSEHILSEEKGDRALLGKWDHSLVVLDHTVPVALLMAYERKADGTELYPKNSLYLSELAVEKQYQGRGIAKKLVALFLERGKKEKLRHLDGPMVFSVQTNAADWNKHVRSLYESFGFEKVGEKQYENRTDVVYRLEA